MDPQAPIVPEVTAQDPVPSETPSSPKDSHGITIAAMAIFVLLSLSAVAFLYYQNQQLKTMIASYRQAQVTPSPVASTDPTANWATCSNSRLGFSVKYPPNFDFDLSNCNYAISDFSQLKDINTVTPVEDFRKNWLLSISSEKSSLDASGWIKSKNLCPSSLCGGTSNGPITNSLAFDIKSHYTETDVVLKTDGTIFRFALNARNPDVSAGSDIKNVFYLILSTFKFIAPAASPSAKPVACTQEAKLCPNGSYVGRTGPNCEFAPCP